MHSQYCGMHQDPVYRSIFSTIYFQQQKRGSPRRPGAQDMTRSSLTQRLKRE